MPFVVAICLVFSQIEHTAIIFYPDTLAIHKAIESLHEELDQTKFHIPLFYRAKATVHTLEIDSFVRCFNDLEKAILHAYTVQENPSFKNVRRAYQALINLTNNTKLPAKYEDATTPGICIATHNIIILNQIASEVKEGSQPIPLQLPRCQGYRKFIRIAKALQAQGKRAPRGKRTVMSSIEGHNRLGVDIDQLKLIYFIFSYPLVDDSSVDKISFPENLSEALEKSDIAIKLYMLGFYENFIYAIEKSTKKDSLNAKRMIPPEMKIACVRIIRLQKDLKQATGEDLSEMIPDICQKISMSKGGIPRNVHERKTALSNQNKRKIKRNLTPTKSETFLYGGIIMDIMEKGIEMMEVDSTAADAVDTTHTGGAP